MRKYEPAQGVCEIKWKSGQPPAGERFGQIIVEIWDPPRLSMNERTSPKLSIRACIQAAQWSFHEGKWIYLFDPSPKEGSEIRRWARPRKRVAHVSLRLSDWI